MDKQIETYKKLLNVIRKDYKTLTAKQLAVKYNLTISQINRILSINKIYKAKKLIITTNKQI
jgi:hypothetical protein